MTRQSAPNWNTRVSYARLLLAAVATTTALTTAGCGRAAVATNDRLPGRSRPVMAHDWKHPRDFKFEAVTFKAPDPGEVVRTSSGVRAFALSSPEETLVRLTAAVPLGRRYERAGEAGASGYVTQMLADPAGWLAGRALAARLAAVGSQVQIEQWLDLTRVSVEVLAEDWREGLQILVDLLRGLKPDPAAVAAYRTGPGYAGVLAGVDGPGFRPAVELQRLVAGYPLAPPDSGLALSPAPVQAVISRSLAPDAVVIGIGGNVPRQDAVAALDKATRGWPSRGDTLTRASVAVRPAAAFIKTVDAPALEGWVAIGRYIEPVAREEQAALAVMADLLGTRLNIAAREIRGLANRNIFLLPQEADYAGLMHIRTGGRPEAVAPLVKVSLDEVRRLGAADDQISAEELERAKGAVVLGQWQAALDGVRAASGTYAVELLRHGRLERLAAWPLAVQAVTAEQVKAVARRYVDPAQMVTVVVGPLDKIRGARHPRWPASLDELANK